MLVRVRAWVDIGMKQITEASSLAIGAIIVVVAHETG